MKTRTFWSVAIIAAGLAAFLATSRTGMNVMNAQVTGQAAVAVDNDDIGGVVTGPRGPEAGVWVIAETTDLPTKFSRTVVTDDAGRYVVPDLPRANYNVWVRGYGLVDSPKVQAQPGRNLNLTAVTAPSPIRAAEYYPGNYWYALMNVPAKSEFPGTGAAGNGISENIRSQAQWLRLMKTDSCEACHQLGSKGTREIPEALGRFPSSIAAWDRRVQSGQAGGGMSNGLNNLGRPRALAMFADWTDRIAAGELPQAPPRPQGVERNIVITQWDWADPKAYLHDEIATDKRNPTVNANGPLYGALELSADYISVLDPVRHTASQIRVPVRDPNTPPAAAQTGFQSSAFWGEEAIWSSKANVHNPMLDERARLWFTSKIRPNDNPAFCKAGSDHRSAKLTPVDNSGRQLGMYDPSTKQVTLIDTCFGTHHLVFAEDANNTLWTSSGGGGGVVGWLNRKMFDETRDEVKSQGWTALILDNNANGKRDAYTQPNEPADAMLDRRINQAFYGVTVSPVDGSVWGTSLGFPGSIVRLSPGSNPPETALAERYELPWDNPGAPVQGFGPRGLDIDRNGVVWVPIASGHLASFDRRKCRGALNGPTATGQHCPEGWTLYPSPGPNFKNVTDSGSADSHYYDWVDQFDTFGLGRNVPIATGNGSDSLLALDPATGRWTVLRVPYPTGFFAKGLDGRIDDPAAGWKGKGLWSTWATRAPFHADTGKGTSSRVVKFQLRPNPLAR
ncbi:MAG: hypothetical protein A3H95_01830 [Acidobacteria bacterium RIFCSPLOWO2_02_FULL_64_15]|nr:MAG: hypothetical protein A3H95_01830 [Acidobacteria bacterium RIFCSPLOWO2_02_FULL_64_15]